MNMNNVNLSAKQPQDKKVESTLMIMMMMMMMKYILVVVVYSEHTMCAMLKHCRVRGRL